MIGDYAEGGLKDIDIESKLLSIKISWMRRLKDSIFHPWKELATYFLLPLGGDSVFNSNLSLAPSLKAKCESLPAFYSEVIKLWEKFSVCSKLTAEQILSEQLWNNKFILSNSKSIDYPALKTKGLAQIRDLFSKDGSVRTWESISQMYDLEPIDFLKWLGVLQSIPPSWKKMIRSCTEISEGEEETNCGIEFEGKYIRIQQITPKIIYKCSVSSNYNPPTAREYFSRKVQITCPDICKSIYLLPRKVTVDTKIRMFQYKILNNILYLNRRLYLMKKVGSPLCSMCGMEVETLAHIIIHCKYSKKLWKDIKEKCSSQLSLPDLTEEIVYLGWLSKGPKSQLVNFIILLYKYYLYTVRKDVRKVCLSAFKWYVNYTQTIEKVIAKKNSRTEKHLSKWDPLRLLLL